MRDMFLAHIKGVTYCQLSKVPFGTGVAAFQMLHFQSNHVAVFGRQKFDGSLSLGLQIVAQGNLQATGGGGRQKAL